MIFRVTNFGRCGKTGVDRTSLLAMTFRARSPTAHAGQRHSPYPQPPPEGGDPSGQFSEGKTREEYRPSSSKTRGRESMKSVPNTISRQV